MYRSRAPLPPLPRPEPSALSRRLIRPLTDGEARLAFLIGEGLNYQQLCEVLGFRRDTIVHQVLSIGDKISECGEAPDSLSGIDRVRFWIVRYMGQTLAQRLELVERELAKTRQAIPGRDGLSSLKQA